MIITRAPFRITLGGGGTVLPSFYERHGGYIFAMTIDKYMYVMLHRLPTTERKSIIRYSQVEIVSAPEEIRHPLAREALLLHNLREHIELTSMADMPAKTGLGSSGAYLVSLLMAIRSYKRDWISLQQLAEEACSIEIDILKEPVGKQDQYMAAFGGFCALNIAPDGRVTVERVPIDWSTANELAAKARIYYTGFQRSASKVLTHQDRAARTPGSAEHDRVVENLCRIKEIGLAIRAAFDERDLDRFGSLMDEHWKAKRGLSRGVSLSVLDELYDEVKKRFSVTGGKIIGAGGGGFLMLYCPRPDRELDAFMEQHHMPRVNYMPTLQGVKIVSDLTPADDFARD